MSSRLDFGPSASSTFSGGKIMAFIDDLTHRITTEVHETLDRAIRQAIQNYLIGEGRATRSSVAALSRTPSRRAARGTGNSAKAARDGRNQIIIDAVSRLGEATIEDVSKATGLDKRGVGSSLYYLAKNGQLKRAGQDRYKVKR